MKFLLNMNVPPSLGKKLAEQGHEYRHVRDIGMAAADDRRITQEAQTQHEIIVTHDLDYGALLAFSGAASPSVIIFRLRNVHPQHLFSRMMRVWSEIAEPLSEGALVVIEDAVLRIRKLPIVAS